MQDKRKDLFWMYDEKEGYRQYPLKIYDSLFSDKQKREKALEFAIRCREFEISKYWTRAGYFWAFITVIYAAYFHVLKFYSDKTFDFGHFPTLALAALGFVFSIAWILSSKGSKHWQENWERHVARLGESIMGPIHAIYKPNSFSVSKINLALGYIVATCAGVLFFFETGKFCKRFGDEQGVSPIGLFFGIVLLAIVGIVAFVLNVVGNENKCTKSSAEKGCSRKGDKS